MIAGIWRKAARAKIKVFITGTTPAMRHSLVRHGVKPPVVTYKHNRYRRDRTRPQEWLTGEPGRGPATDSMIWQRKGSLHFRNGVSSPKASRSRYESRRSQRCGETRHHEATP
jgi:hypothetical protein